MIELMNKIASMTIAYQLGMESTPHFLVIQKTGQMVQPHVYNILIG